MPVIHIKTSAPLVGSTSMELLQKVSKMASEILGKPEQYVMATLQSAEMMMSGQNGAAAWVEVRSIGGLNREVNKRMAKKLCALLKLELGIGPERVYINYIDIKPENWGWNSETFG
jgi:phenylpyruvate tautomerase PptA (4-oxalocrotonate tautomerase family)